MTMANTLKQTATAMSAGFNFIKKIGKEEEEETEGAWHFLQVWCANLEHDWRCARVWVTVTVTLKG